MLDGHTAVLWAGSIYMWGGKEDAPTNSAASRYRSAVYSNTMYILNPSECISKPTTTLEKMQLASETPMQPGVTPTSVIPKGRAFHSAALYGKLMFVTGGLTDELDTVSLGAKSTEDPSVIPVFDLERRIWVMKSSFGDVPIARCHHVSVVYGDTLMVHGGYPVLSERNRELTAEEMASMQHALYDVCELNIATMRWRRIQNAQSPALWGHTAVMYNKNVLLFGGVDVVENCESGAVAVWHTEKKMWRWADFENLDLRCALHSAVQDGGRMLVFSGVSFKSHTKLRSLYEFNLEFGAWRELNPKGAPPLGRIGHCAVAYNQCMLIIGGSVETQNNPSMVGGKPERAVHVYNMALNEWRTCALTFRHLSENDTSAAAAFGNQPLHEKSWSTANMNQGVTQAAQDEWGHTSQQVKDTIARAKAIQSLADSAMTTATSQSSPSQPRGQHEGRSPGGTPKQIVPFDDNKRGASPYFQTQRNPPGSMPVEVNQTVPYDAKRSLSQTQTERTPAELQLEKLRDMRQGLSNEESRRAIEFLQKENEKLRCQLDDFRSGSAQPTAMSGRNPYEVPIYNTAGGTVPLPENEGVATFKKQQQSPLQSRPPDKTLNLNTLGEYVPRMNLNAADPPRAVAGSSNSYMSRPAVSALVQSTLNSNVTASSTLAIPPPTAGSSSLDPMSFLTGPSVTAQTAAGQPAWHPANYQPPQTYDQLLGRAHAGGTGTNLSGYGGLPLTLQPLLTVLQNTQPMPMQAPSGNTPRVGFTQPTLQQTGPVPTQQEGRYEAPTVSRVKAPSLNRLISGGSMLSISHVTPRRY